MLKLTQEQIKTLEDTFSSYSDEFKKTHPNQTSYNNIEGVNRQIESLKGVPGNILYVIENNNSSLGFSIGQMFIEDQSPEPQQPKSSLTDLELVKMKIDIFSLTADLAKGKNWTTDQFFEFFKMVCKHILD